MVFIVDFIEYTVHAPPIGASCSTIAHTALDGLDDDIYCTMSTARHSHVSTTAVPHYCDTVILLLSPTIGTCHGSAIEGNPRCPLASSKRIVVVLKHVLSVSAPIAPPMVCILLRVLDSREAR